MLLWLRKEGSVAIDSLYAEHRALEAQVDMLLRIVRAATPDTAAVAAMRWAIAQQLVTHCAHEDALVYDPMISCGDTVAASAAASCRAMHGELVSSFASYIAAWPVARIAAEWPLFRDATQVLAAALRHRMQDEEEQVYAHAERMMRRRAA
jgi:hypothetical protein